MIISLAECAAVVEELQRTLTDGIIQKIHQPDPCILTLNVRIPGDTHCLFISLERGYARIHLSSLKFQNPQTPLQFCQYLRSHIEGGRITRIAQEPDDRILYLTITKSSMTYTVVVALTGNQSNVHVLNESWEILRSLKSSKIETGQVYMAPQRSARHVPSSPTTLSDICEQEQPTQDKQGKSAPNTFAKRFPVSAKLEEQHQFAQASDKRLAWFRTQSATLRKKLKQAVRRERTLEADLLKAETYREYRRYGELLKSQLHAIEPRQTVVQVVDYFDPSMPTLSLPLNALHDAVWNMEDYFRKYRKYLSAQEHLQPRLERTHDEIKTVKAELSKLEQEELEVLVNGPPSDHPKDDNAFQLAPEHAKKERPHTKKADPQPAQAIRTQHKAAEKEKASVRAKPYRLFESFDGLLIFVGKSAKDNDTLTLKIAKPDDLWLHARGCPGSHVVVRLEKATEVPHETLRDAATLALFYSDLKKSGKGEVIYTLRKFVKKPKGLKAGAVHVTREKSLWIEVKKERLDRLKGGC
ncbi:MAG: NFACT family protein [Nitrospirales bacterium]|nr:NFACT family protein [Nitrospira sp.]MDR4502914.1 NFACT family protein [Nitrospirales bacterium]